MTGVVSLAGDAIARGKSLHVPADLQNNARIAIACISWKTWFPARLTPVYVIVYFSTYTDGCIIIFDEHAVIRHGRKFILRQCNLPKISVD